MQSHGVLPWSICADHAAFRVKEINKGAKCLWQLLHLVPLGTPITDVLCVTARRFNLCDAETRRT